MVFHAKFIQISARKIYYLISENDSFWTLNSIFSPKNLNKLSMKYHSYPKPTAIDGFEQKLCQKKT